MTFVGLILLVMIGWLVLNRLATPTQLARFLPADSTFAFFQLTTTRDSNAFQNLKTLYAGVPPTELADGAALGLTNVDQFLNLVGGRVGVAFFGEAFNPTRFALLADVSDESAVQDYFRTQLLPDESLVETAYRGDTIFTFARSRSTAFILIGDGHLVYAADVSILKSVLDAARGRIQKLSESADYGAVIARLDPRVTGFAYLSPAAVHALVLQKLAGIDYALAGALTSEFTSGGVELIPTADGLTARVFLAAAPSAARAELFTARPKFTTSLTNLVTLESPTWWYAGHDAASELATFTTKLSTLASPDAALLTGYLDRLTKNYLGRDATFTHDLAPLLSGDFLVGRTSADELFFVAKGESISAAAPRMIDLLTAGDGLLTAGEESFTLPDGSTGRRRVAGISDVTHSPLGVAITTVGANGHTISYALVGDTFIVGSSAALVARFINRLAAPTFSESISYSTDDAFTLTLPTEIRTLPWLAPFTSLHGGRVADPAGVTVEVELRN